MARAAFISRNIFQLFDSGRKGYLDFDDFYEAEWAGFLAFAAPNACVVTRSEFIESMIGRPGEAGNGWNVPYAADGEAKAFGMYDKTQKGYIAKSDILERVKRDFARLDKRKEGRLYKSYFGSSVL